MFRLTFSTFSRFLVKITNKNYRRIRRPVYERLQKINNIYQFLNYHCFSCKPFIETMPL